MSLRKFLGLEGPAKSPPAATATGGVPRPLPQGVGVGLYGKLPTQADFVRLNAGTFATAGFDQWLEEGVGAVHAARGTPSQALVAFFAHSPLIGSPCIGVLGPSRDKVGRAFPAALFTYLDPALAGLHAFAGSAAGAFLFQAQAVVAGLPEATAAPDLSELAPPTGADQARAAEDAAGALEASPLGDCLDGLFGGTTPDVHAHALATCLAACGTAKGRCPDKTAVTLELPAADDRARDFWLAFLATALQWPTGAPTWLWDDRADRLLVALGPPAPSLFVALAMPDWVGARHWVIRSQLPDTSPPTSLPPALEGLVMAGGGTVADLLEATRNGLG